MQAVTSPEHVHQHSLVSSQSKMQFLLHLPTNPNKNLFTIKRHLHTEKTEEKNPETRTNTQGAIEIHLQKTRIPTHQRSKSNHSQSPTIEPSRIQIKIVTHQHHNRANRTRRS